MLDSETKGDCRYTLNSVQLLSAANSRPEPALVAEDAPTASPEALRQDTRNPRAK